MTQDYGSGSDQDHTADNSYVPGWQPQSPGYPMPPQEGQSAATTSLVLGIIGFFTFGIVLGPLAIYFAIKAERNGVQATAGKVLGWIVTILHAIGILIGIVVVIFVIAAASASIPGSGLIFEALR